MPSNCTPCSGLASLLERYRYIVCDIWGVLHDGGAILPDSAHALEKARASGARVIALSNSPKRANQVRDQLAEKGLTAAALDAVITSGELTREHLERHWAGRRFYHLGPDRDRMTVTDLPLTQTGTVESADVLVATGLVADSIETHESLLRRAVAHGLVFLCANPDRLVRLESGREFCAGLLADSYAALGGHVEWMGKPAAAPYRACRRRFAAWAGAEVGNNEILAIGDGLATDILGAERAGLAALFIEDGLHRDEIAEHGFEAVLARYGAAPAYRMARLAWTAPTR